jgi:Tol biopolymer transport system component/uncharacterized GH25 family protein
MLNMTRIAITLAFLLTLTAAHASNDLGGVVLDANSKPLPGATVYIYTASPRVGVSAFCASCYRDCGKHATVDQAGKFRLSALDPTLRFELLTVAEGYEPSMVRQIDPVSGPVTIHLSQRSAADADRLIRGIVVDPDGKPVVGASVAPNALMRDGQTIYGRVPSVDQLSLTNTKGEFALRIPNATAKLNVLVTARSLAPRIERMLAAGEPRKIMLTEGATISGHVLRDGKPLAGARIGFVQANRESSGYLGHAEIGTNEDGLFVMTNLAPNLTYMVYTPLEEHPAGVASPKVVTVGGDKTSTDVGVFEAGPGRRIAGRVKVPAGWTIPPHTRITVGLYAVDDARTIDVADDGTFSVSGVPEGVAILSMPIPGLTLQPVPSDGREVLLPEKGDVTDVALVFEVPHASAPVTTSAAMPAVRVTSSGNVIHAAISPDAKAIVYVTAENNLQALMLRELGSAKEVTLIPARKVEYGGVTFTPDLSAIGFEVKENPAAANVIFQISAKGGQARKIVDAADSPPTFSPDGKRMAFLRAAFPSSEESSVMLANADGSDVRTVVSVHKPELFAPIVFGGASWSPDGTVIATALMRIEQDEKSGRNKPTTNIVAVDVATGAVKTVLDHGLSVVTQVTWMPDQKGLVAIALGPAARHLQVWYVPYAGGEPQPVTRDRLDYRTISASADGNSLLTVGSEEVADVTSRDAILITGLKNRSN